MSDSQLTRAGKKKALLVCPIGGVLQRAGDMQRGQKEKHRCTRPRWAASRRAVEGDCRQAQLVRGVMRFTGRRSWKRRKNECSKLTSVWMITEAALVRQRRI